MGVGGDQNDLRCKGVSASVICIGGWLGSKRSSGDAVMMRFNIGCRVGESLNIRKLGEDLSSMAWLPTNGGGRVDQV